MRKFGSLRALAAALIVPASLALAASDPKPPELRLPPVAEPIEYAADLTIDPATSDFHGSVDVSVRIKTATDILWLNAAGLKVAGVKVTSGGSALPVRVVPGGEDFVGFAFDRAVAPGNLRLQVDYSGSLDETSTQGLFRQKDGEDWYAFSQFESTDARRAFPCFDEPSYKVPWQVTLRIPKGDSAVSNTPVVSDAVEGDLRVVRFKRTVPLPSYLIALAVGPFEYLDAGTAGSKKTPIRIVTPRGKTAQGRYAAQTTGPLFDWLETYFGIPYPYEKLDQLSIPVTVTFGAMENAGLITWSEHILLASPAEETVDFQRVQASINAHEMAHQWFGDLVTLAWWDDTWLNESFATWLAYRAIIAWKPEWHEDVSRVRESSSVMTDDTLATARKIRQEIQTRDDIVNAFDDISYHKGSAVLTMFESWIGPEKFRSGVHAYLQAHEFGSATERDFLQAIEAASRPGVAAAFSTFLDQPGVPVIEVACGGKPDMLSAMQKRLLPVGSKGSSAETWKVPVCTRGGSGGTEARTCGLLEASSGSVPAPAGACSGWLLANDGELGYYRTRYRGDQLSKLLGAGDSRLSVAERVGVIRDVSALAEAGALPYSESLALVPRFGGDPSREIVASTVHIATAVREHLVPAELQPNYARFVTGVFGPRATALGFATRPSDGDDTRLLRSMLVPFVAGRGDDRRLQAEARRLSLAWLGDRRVVDPEMAGGVLVAAARHGDADLFDRFVSAARVAKERRDRGRLFRALGVFPDPALVRKALALHLSPDFDSRETAGIVYQASHPENHPQVVWDFLRENFDAIVARTPREIVGALPELADGFCDAGHRQEVEAFFQGRLDKLPGGPRNLAQTLEAIDLCIAGKAVQQGYVREFLQGY